MNDLRKAAVKALHALEDPNRDKHVANTADAINSLRQALAQPEQKPVAYLYHDTACAELANPLADSTLLVLACDRKPNGLNETPLYTAPNK
jgi:hypothetical protein